MAKLLDLIYYTPKNCRWTDVNPPKFTIWLNILYACAGGFTAANLYYSHPILEVLARDFNVSQTQVSSIPTLATAGDATGLLLIMPLADFLPRRRFTLTLMFLTVAFWLGLCVTSNLNIFMALTYLSALFTGVTQVMIPLVADLAPPESRAFSIAIVGTGPTFAILLARILSGVVATYTSWRNIYWIALGLQLAVLISLFLFMPDYPAINKTTPRELVRSYPKIMWSIIVLFAKHPALVQASMLSYCTFFTVSSFWTTLTFLLSDSPYNYSTAVIGLFGFIGAATVVLGPVYAKYIIQPLKVPLYSAAIGTTVSLVGIVIGTFVGRFNVAGPVIQALLLDAGLMIEQIANRMSLQPISPQSRNRVNTAFVSLLYLGQLSGTKAGNEVYAKHGGWLASGGLSIGVIALSYVWILLHGPNETGWIGWSGGWKYKTDNEKAEKSSDEVSENAESLEKVVTFITRPEHLRDETASVPRPSPAYDVEKGSR